MLCRQGSDELVDLSCVQGYRKNIKSVPLRQQSQHGVAAQQFHYIMTSSSVVVRVILVVRACVFCHLVACMCSGLENIAKKKHIQRIKQSCE